MILVTGSLARSASRRDLIYSEADFEVFRLAGATRCTDGVKFGVVLHAKFHLNQCNDKGVGPPKLKFILRFDQNVEYKRPAGVSLVRFSPNLQSLYHISGSVSC